MSKPNRRGFNFKKDPAQLNRHRHSVKLNDADHAEHLVCLEWLHSIGMPCTDSEFITRALRAYYPQVRNMMARHAAQQEKASQAADKEQVVIDQVLAMRDAGELAYRIAEKMGLTKTFVRKVLKQFPKKD